MKLYVAHSRDFDYQQELYKPLRESKLNNIAEIILPHEFSDKPFNSKDEIEKMDYVIAEVSYPSTGLGIELGWANIKNVPIIALCKKGAKLSNSVRLIANQVIEYDSSEDLIIKLIEILENNITNRALDA